MIASELTAISEELEAIKAEAFAAGRRQAIEDHKMSFVQLQNDTNETMKFRQEWKNVMSIIQEAYQTHQNKSMSLIDSDTNTFGQPTMYSLKFPSDLEEFCNELHTVVIMGRDFERLLSGIKENDLLKAQWDRLMVVMRMYES